MPLWAMSAEYRQKRRLQHRRRRVLHTVARQIDLGDAPIGQAAHLNGIAHTVLVGVLPDHELGKLGVPGIEQTVHTGV